MILHARWVVDRSLRVHENAWLDTRDNTIGREKPKRQKVTELGSSILMPGLVNAHCHLDYTDMRGRIRPAKHFVEWISRIVRLKNTWTQPAYTRSIQHGLDEALEFGTTTMANWICSPDTMRGLRPRPMRVVWLWEQIAFRGEDISQGWNAWPSRCSKFSSLWTGALAPHAPYTCSTEMIRKVVKWSSARKSPWSIHAAESREEEAMFRHGRGPMFDMFKGRGREMSDCGKRSPLLFLKSQSTRAPLLLVHVNHLERADYALLKPSISIVHCPRSHDYFRHQRFPLVLLQKKKVNICLGTDSLASNVDLSMFGEMRRCARSYPKLEPREIVRMATINGAVAMGMKHEWRGWRDWIAIPSAGRRDVWRQITGFTGKPHFVMVGGEVVLCPH